MLAVAIVWALFVPLADWLARHDVGSVKGSLLQTARDAARGRLLTLGAGLVAAGALLFTARTFILSREGQVTDRYTKAVEQLGSDKLDVRIGGIYALERVARDSAKDHPTVMEVLTAFIRDHSPEPWPSLTTGRRSRAATEPQERSTRPDIQAAIAVVGRRDAEHDTRLIDFTRADLTRADLSDANLGGEDRRLAVFTYQKLGGESFSERPDKPLTRADLTRADLSDANLIGATLREVPGVARRLKLVGAILRYTTLTGADLTGADLTRADLTGADLTRADLTRAHLDGAHLDGAHLDGANLTDANLEEAHLDGAHLDGATLISVDRSRVLLANAHLRGAYLRGADLTGAHLIGAHLDGAILDGAILDGALLGGANLGGANLSGANLTGANLIGANLTGAHLDGAILDGALLVGANLTDANLTDAFLVGSAILTRARLTERTSPADLTDADLTRARWPTDEPVPEGWMVDSDSGRLKRAGRLSASVPRGVVASARKSGAGCGAVACWGLGLVVVLGLPGLAVPGMMVRAARDAEPLWDKSPFISLALGPDPVGRFLLP